MSSLHAVDYGVVAINLHEVADIITTLRQTCIHYSQGVPTMAERFGFSTWLGFVFSSFHSKQREQIGGVGCSGS